MGDVTATAERSDEGCDAVILLEADFSSSLLAAETEVQLAYIQLAATGVTDVVDMTVRGDVRLAMEDITVAKDAVTMATDVVVTDDGIAMDVTFVVDAVLMATDVTTQPESLTSCVRYFSTRSSALSH